MNRSGPSEHMAVNVSANLQPTSPRTLTGVLRVGLAALLALVSVLLLPAVASAQYATPPSSVSPSNFNNPTTTTTNPGNAAAAPASLPVVRGTSQARQGSLPLTGGDVAALVAGGLGALAVGGVLVATARRRRSEHYI